MSELLARHGAVIPNWVGISCDEPVQIVSGKGCRVTDSQGSSYLDFFASILTNMLGYDVPEVRDAVERQIATGVVHMPTHAGANPGTEPTISAHRSETGNRELRRRTECGLA